MSACGTAAAAAKDLVQDRRHFLSLEVWLVWPSRKENPQRAAYTAMPLESYIVHFLQLFLIVSLRMS